MAYTIQEHLDRRYQNNPYAGRGTRGFSQSRKQYPKRMYRAPKYAKNGRPQTPEDVVNSPASVIPTEEEIDRMLMPKHLRDQAEQQGDPGREHLAGLELVNRHRYGDDIDILRTVFTKTKEEIEKEKFFLILASRKLLQRLFWSLQKVPKHERFVLGSDIRSSAYTILRHSIGIKKRFYRKNMLEYIDVELDVLRELYRTAHQNYSEWVDDQHLQLVYDDINEVGKIVGGLLNTTVC